MSWIRSVSSTGETAGDDETPEKGVKIDDSIDSLSGSFERFVSLLCLIEGYHVDLHQEGCRTLILPSRSF